MAAFVLLATLRPPRPPMNRLVLQAKVHEFCTAEVMPDLSLSLPSLDAQTPEDLYSIILKGQTSLLSFMSTESIQQKRVEEFVSALRLGDSHDERNFSDFRQDWNRFWLLSNLFQFLPNFSFVSTEYIRSTSDEPQVEISRIITNEQEWAQVFRFASADISDLLLACQDAQVLPPVIGYEVLDSSGRVCASAEAAWEDKKLAILMPDVAEYKPVFEDLGWIIFSSSDTSSIFLETYRTR